MNFLHNFYFRYFFPRLLTSITIVFHTCCTVPMASRKLLIPVFGAVHRQSDDIFFFPKLLHESVAWKVNSRGPLDPVNCGFSRRFSSKTPQTNYCQDVLVRKVSTLIIFSTPRRRRMLQTVDRVQVVERLEPGSFWFATHHTVAQRKQPSPSSSSSIT
jgi:hypothetical protein